LVKIKTTKEYSVGKFTTEETGVVWQRWKNPKTKEIRLLVSLNDGKRLEIPEKEATLIKSS